MRKKKTPVSPNTHTSLSSAANYLSQPKEFAGFVETHFHIILSQLSLDLMDEETSEEVDQLIFSRMHFMRLTVELSYQFVILVHLSGWTALEKLCLSSEMTHVGKTTLAIR